ncbi:hypothetical protein [Pseudofulvimonas gallinarii]
MELRLSGRIRFADPLPACNYELAITRQNQGRRVLAHQLPTAMADTVTVIWAAIATRVSTAALAHPARGACPWRWPPTSSSIPARRSHGRRPAGSCPGSARTGQNNTPVPAMPNQERDGLFFDSSGRWAWARAVATPKTARSMQS